MVLERIICWSCTSICVQKWGWLWKPVFAVIMPEGSQRISWCLPIIEWLITSLLCFVTQCTSKCGVLLCLAATEIIVIINYKACNCGGGKGVLPCPHLCSSLMAALAHLQLSCSLLKTTWSLLGSLLCAHGVSFPNCLTGKPKLTSRDDSEQEEQGRTGYFSFPPLTFQGL